VRYPQIAQATSRLIFAGDDGTTGIEPWSVSLLGPGAVPNGASVPGEQLSLTELPGGDLALDWAPSSCNLATDYVVHEGTIGDYASHDAIVCSTGGETQTTITPSAGSRYYLIAPRDDTVVGSNGRSSIGAPRPPANTACLPRALGEICE
jgi:hypothetical protein